MTKTLVRRLLSAAARVLPYGIIPLDAILRMAQRTTGAIASVLFARDWKLGARGGPPMFFKHQINLSRWIAEPFRWSFTARGGIRS